MTLLETETRADTRPLSLERTVESNYENRTIPADGRDRMIDRDSPYFGVLDIVAFALAALMTLGPMAAYPLGLSY